jgi:hypothetical protein
MNHERATTKKDILNRPSTGTVTGIFFGLFIYLYIFVKETAID